MQDCDSTSQIQTFFGRVSPQQFSPPPLDIRCQFCNGIYPQREIRTHEGQCALQGKPCPLKSIGCPEQGIFVNQSDLERHVKENEYSHLNLLVESVQRLSGEVDARSVQEDAVQPQAAMANVEEIALVPGSIDTAQLEESMRRLVKDVLGKQEEEMRLKLKSKDDEITNLKAMVTELEKTMRTKQAEIEDRDFRLSLIENSNYDGSMIWKIPQFSQRRADAQNGKYTSIFSLPFYSGRYGYKMCLRLYIMGDGIGKGTHLSLFFVVMRGEFDNILQWPFTHKVTFKLINQAGGQDIVDTFQPDPMSSSFRQPESDMNIASGCPRFVSHTELERGGSIVDDTVFIKCMIDTSTIRHP